MTRGQGPQHHGRIRLLGFLLALGVFQLSSPDGSAQSASSRSLLARLAAARSSLKISFTVSPRYPVEGQPVQFTSTVKGSPVSWAWDFGDGTISREQNPTHVYHGAGFRRVILVVSDDRGSKSMSRTLTVLPGLGAATFVFSPATPGPGETVRFTDTTSGAPTAWQWNFGDGATSTVQNPSHAFSQVGSYTVSLVAREGSGSRQGSQTVKVATVSVLASSFTFAPALPVTGQAVQFTDTSTGQPTSWLWDFGDGTTSAVQHPSHAYATAGSKTVTLTVANGSTSNTANRTVSVTAALQAYFTFAPASPAANESVQFTDSSTPSPTSWQWSFGDGATSTSQNPRHTYASAGTYSVLLAARNSSGQAEVSRAITVSAASAVVASFTSSPSPAAVAEIVQFTDTSTGTPTSWLWAFGDGGTSTSRNPSHSYTAAGTYAVSLTASAGTRSDTASRTITIVPSSSLQASFAFSPHAPAPGQAVAFRDASTGSPTSWQWNFGDGGTSLIQNPSHSFAAEGSYSVTLIVGNASGTDTVNQTVMVASTSELIPDDRLMDWSYAGVPGGIPVRTTVYQSLGVAGQSPSYAQSLTATEINSALASCPAGQVVLLQPGTYTVGRISFSNLSGKTLRGAGAGRTILRITSQISGGSGAYFTESRGIPVSSGATQGSMSIVLGSAPTSQFAAGNLIVLAEDASPNKWGTGIGTYYRTGLTAGQSVWALDQTRIFRHMNRITGVSGNTVSLAAPLPLDFTPALNIKAYPPDGSNHTTLCGIEDLTVDAQNSVDTPIKYESSDRCWVKGVELKNVPGSDVGMIRIYQCFQCEVRRCYIHDATGYPDQTDGYAISLNYGASNCRLEDNVVDRVAELCETNGAAGNAFLYNYVRDNARAGLSALDRCVGQGLSLNHGPHGFMNLVEGNILPRIVNDGYHGSTSHCVIFRNSVNGLNSDPYLSWHRRLLNLCRGSYFHTVVGNVIGDASWAPNYYEMSGSPGYNNDWSIYSLGYPWADSTGLGGSTWFANWSKPSGVPDPDVKGTLLRHGNFDYYNKSVIWDEGLSSRIIPASLIYASKPAYFGSVVWPPIGPDVSGLVTDNPARARWNAYQSSGKVEDLFKDM